MFRANKKHRQTGIFGIQNSLPTRLQEKLQNSSYQYFYKTIFCNIIEEDFKVLYSKSGSRPNSPVNCLVGALLLKHKNNWTYEELFEQMEFNLLTKTALGLDTLDDIPFDDATIYNFQNRLLKHYVETNENLLEQVFDKLTTAQLKELKLKTDIQRSDSLMASSNIRSYGRLQLLVEVLLRLWRLMSESDKAQFGSTFTNYTKKTSGQYIYKLKASDLPHEMEKIAAIYHFCKLNIMPKYQTTDFNRVFERVYTEHFTVITDKITVRASSELNSSCLQSPDDIDATYRVKRQEEYRGQSINIVETASPENELNLITDVAVNANNIDDAEVLTRRTDKMLAKTPDLKELHTDGAYGNAENDKILAEHSIVHVQTAVRGRKSDVSFEIAQATDGNYQVSCPYQTVAAQATAKRNKAFFAKSLCESCRLADKCPVVERKSGNVYYFTHDDYLRNQRIRNILKIPFERRKIRPNVEATVHEFSCRLRNGKLKVRGNFKAQVFAYLTATAINFGRLFRHWLKISFRNCFFWLFLVEIISYMIESVGVNKIIFISTKNVNYSFTNRIILNPM